MVLIAFVIAVLVFSSSVNAKAPLLGSDSDTIIKNEYIVVMNEDLSDEEIQSHKNTVRTTARLQGNFSYILFEYNIGKGFRGYSIFADDKMVDVLRTMIGVKYVEYNQEMHALDCKGDCVCQVNAEWGLHRTISRVKKPESEDYAYDGDAAGNDVAVYILDTGIYLENDEFVEERAVWGESFVNSNLETDKNGHGTHVAGTVIGNTYGLAKKATAIAVQVLDSSGSGSTAGVIAGVDFTVSDNPKKTKKIANMSLGGGYSTALNTAVNTAVTKGVHFAVAAGNENQDACNVSPASAELCVTVASIDNSLKRSYFSNYGKCVDIFAPGGTIKSAWIGNARATNTISGTSMASPHVAGVMAMILSAQDLKPADMKEFLDKTATSDVVIDEGTGSPNRLLYRGCPTES